MNHDLCEAKMSQTGLMAASGTASEACPSQNTFSKDSRAQLHPELWAMTISTMRDRKSQAELAYLWITVRRVSKQFEWAVENLFRKEHFGKTWIFANSGTRSTLTPAEANLPS